MNNIYQFLTFPRTGSTYAQRRNMFKHARDKLHVIYLDEFFTGRYKLTNHWFEYNSDIGLIDPDDINTEKNKIEFLEEKRNQGIHFSIKIMGNMIDDSNHDILVDYLNNYKILTIDRNPFDVFLSRKFLDTINIERQEVSDIRKISHGFDKSMLDKLDITYTDIELFCHDYKKHKSLINKCNVYRTFNFENLEEDLNEFFPIANTPLEKNNIDYRSLVTDIELIESTFNELFTNFQ